MENISESESPIEMDSPFCNTKFQNNYLPNYPQKTLNATHVNYEEYRIRTFKSWPVQAPVQADRLARAGFYYLGKGLEVICFSCGGRISDWTYGDIAMQKHSSLFPNCPFVNNQSNNVPVSKRFQGYGYEIQNGNYNEQNGHGPMQVPHNGHGPTQVPHNGHGPTQVPHNGYGPTQVPHNGYGPSRVLQGSPVPSTSVNTPGVSMSNGYHPPRELQHAFPMTNGGSFSPKPQVLSVDMQIRMKYENERLKSFIGKWPLGFISPADLSRCGFYYLDIMDKVQCAFCGGVLTKWEPGDKPYAEHKKNFPLCPFIMGIDVGNVPRGEDICGGSNPRANEKRRMPNSGPENKAPPSIENLEAIGVAVHKGPHYPSQASKDARLRSFLPWPQHSPVKAEELVEAGFFYIGIKDNVKCFYCDGGLSNWELGDDPWMEHARWFPNCYFVRLNKGMDFIKQSLARGQFSPEGRVLIVNRTSSGYSSLSSGESEEYPRSPVSSPSVSEEEDITEIAVEPSPLDLQVEEAMKSNLVQAFLRTNVYPAHVVRHAVLRKFQMTGTGVYSIDELSEAIQVARSEPLESRVGNKSQDDKTQCKTLMSDMSNPKLHPVLSSSDSKTELSLEEENRQLKEQRLCKICMDQEVGVVFVPCGHLIACVQCAPALTDCALCRTAIKGTVRTFLS